MSNELSISAGIAYSDSELDTFDLAVQAGLTDSITTKKYIKDKMAVTITELVIPLGSVTALGWAVFINRDPTNFIELRVATGGIKFVRLRPLKPALFYFGSGITAPFAIADTATCQMSYLIFSQ